MLRGEQIMGTEQEVRGLVSGQVYLTQLGCPGSRPAYPDLGWGHTLSLLPSSAITVQAALGLP